LCRSTGAAEHRPAITTRAFIVAFILVAVLLWNLWDAWVLLMSVADEEIAKGESFG